MSRKGFNIVEVLVVVSIVGVLLVLLIPAIVAARRASTPEGRAIIAEHNAQEYQVAAQNNADYVVGKISYIKDPRTGFCFAFMQYDRGAALTLVPKEKIPPNLLKTAKLNAEKE